MTAQGMEARQGRDPASGLDAQRDSPVGNADAPMKPYQIRERLNRLRDFIATSRDTPLAAIAEREVEQLERQLREPPMRRSAAE
jgi:hypothetical protein